MVTACTQYRNDLSAYLDDELDNARKSDISLHLVSCGDCRKEYEGLKAVSRVVFGGLEDKDLSNIDLWSQLSERLPTVCQAIQEDLSAYLDGELPPPAQEGIHQHLKDCRDCLEQFSRLNATNRLLVCGLKLPDSIKVEL